MLDPQARQFLQIMADNGVKPAHTLTAPEARAAYLQRRSLSQSASEAVALTRDHTLTHSGVEIGIREYRPQGSAAQSVLPALLFFHGGGWTVGDLDTHDTVCRSLCNASGSAVFAVDYRLGPEAPFPAAYDDALAAFAWLVQHAAQVHIAPARIAVGGDSAGGNLALDLHHRRVRQALVGRRCAEHHGLGAVELGFALLHLGLGVLHAPARIAIFLA